MHTSATLNIYSFDPARRLHAIRFIRAVTRLRDGEPTSLRAAKAAVEALREGRISYIEIPGAINTDTRPLSDLIDLAAKGAGVNTTAPRPVRNHVTL